MNYLTVDLFREFKCVAGECLTSCCTGGWNIKIEKENYKRMCDKEKQWGVLAKDWIVDRDGCLFVRFDDEDRCPMLTQDGLCNVSA